MQAQTQVLVSNVGQSNAVFHLPLTFDRAQAFTTGSNSAGYTLNSVDIRFRRVADSALASKLTATIRNSSGGSPGTVVGTLTVPAIATSTSEQTITFTHSGLDLAANTTYFFTLDLSSAATGNNQILVPTTFAEDGGGASGWSIGNSLHGRSIDDGAWGVSANTVIKIRINGAVKSSNAAPTVANAIPDRTATAGTSFTYAFPANTFNDANSDSLTYTATRSDGSALPSWLTFTPLSRSFSGTPAAGDTGTLTVRVTADDSNGGTVSDEFDIAVGGATATCVSLDAGSHFVYEGSVAKLTVLLKGTHSQPVTVQLWGSGGSATAGDDYTGGTGHVTIPAGSTSATFDIQTVADAVAGETDETFNVVIAGISPSSISICEPSATTVTIMEPEYTIPGVSVSGGVAGTDRTQAYPGDRLWFSWDLQLEKDGGGDDIYPAMHKKRFFVSAEVVSSVRGLIHRAGHSVGERWRGFGISVDARPGETLTARVVPGRATYNGGRRYAGARDRAELVTDDAAELRAQLEAVTGERIAALEAIGEMPREAAVKDAGTGLGEERGRDAEPGKAGERQPRVAPPREREAEGRAAQAERDGVGRPGHGGDARPARERGGPSSPSKPREAPVREPGKGKGVDLGL